jgi:hypothetical protein
MVTPQTILANIGMHMNEVGNIVQNIQKQCTVCAVNRMPGKLILGLVLRKAFFFLVSIFVRFHSKFFFLLKSANMRTIVHMCIK